MTFSKRAFAKKIGLLAATMSVLASCSGFETPDARPNVQVDYPIEHYRITDNPADFAAWKAEVRALRGELRKSYPFEDQRPVLEGSSREVEFMDKAVDPALIIWRDPAAFWRDPVNLSWWERIDDEGAIQEVFVISSNQPPETDARIIAWCLRDKSWKPAVIDGETSPSIRSASINLGESKWHVSYWIKKVPAESVVLFAIVIAALVVRGVIVTYRRRQARAGSAES